ncbi:MAG TPA: type II secretion system minor pseudopilin GspI [Steroidobacteraceae bacterium]|nr:type II secretion system minor pseudopilin GspI [Steroidobacteraceae bacterium]
MSAGRLGGARGFTLIEVLVALAIVTVGMAAVLGTVSSSADTEVYLRDKTFANWVALNQIAQVRVSGQLPAPGKSDGDSEFAGRKWHWHQEVTTTQVPGMVRMDVSVRPADAQSTDSDRGWYATVSGISGDAVGAPRGDLPDWGAQLLTPGSNAAGGTPATTPGATPGTAPGVSPTGPQQPGPPTRQPPGSQ